jgi:hypothetical protein
MVEERGKRIRSGFRKWQESWRDRGDGILLEACDASKGFPQADRLSEECM